jgi:hypothetical protein
MATALWAANHLACTVGSLLITTSLYKPDSTPPKSRPGPAEHMESVACTSQLFPSHKPLPPGSPHPLLSLGREPPGWYCR